MVVKIIRWRPWPPQLVTTNFVVKLVVSGLEGCDRQPVELVAGVGGGEGELGGVGERLAVEIAWKGGESGGRRIAGLMGRRRGREVIKRNYTGEERVGEEGGVSWEEEFESACSLVAYKENNAGGCGGGGFLPWIIGFTVFKGMNHQSRNKVSVMGRTSLNLSEFACSGGKKDIQLKLPVSQSGNDSLEFLLLLSVSLFLVELRASHEAVDSVERAVLPMPCLSPLRCGDVVSAEKDEQSALKSGLKKVKMLTDFVPVRRPKKASAEEERREGKCSPKSEDGNYPFDSNSLDDYDEGESEESSKEISSARKSVSYGTLAYANTAGGANARIYVETDDCVYYINRRLNVDTSDSDDAVASISEKGEPLLKMAYAEEGGDDIDFDCRQLSSDESLSLGWGKTDEDFSAHRSSMSDFGDDNCHVGARLYKAAAHP
ncbi:hypothetical protein MLD38_035591 [Melastoma candidum]|uniref:Uncharacterized protein n=1 Tax=Melastoma candidum TaxID=119954 RepID=A0ACB9LHH8_9MYRT|nr:hypothetical protein MLD38_035591 [Melastoma candidum]